MSQAMNRCAKYLPAILVAFAVTSLSLATDLFYDDITAHSLSTRYRVDAVSSDNADKTQFRAFQAHFTYTCRDTFTNTVLWTRKQAMNPPYRYPDGSLASYQLPNEQSPIALFVSDDGWTVIYTGWREFIVVDINGQDRGKVKLLEEGFTRRERELHVHDTTAGPMWDGQDDYFFRNVGKDSLFVTRPPWGRAVIINLETGKLNDEKAASTKAVRAGDFNRPWDDPKALARTIAYTLSLILLPFVIGCGIWMQRGANKLRSAERSVIPPVERKPEC
jgi:hypothetical protein